MRCSEALSSGDRFVQKDAGDLAEPAADQRQTEKQLRNARATVFLIIHAEI